MKNTHRNTETQNDRNNTETQNELTAQELQEEILAIITGGTFASPIDDAFCW